MAFALAAVNPASPAIPSAIGQSGGALGYSAQNSTTNGLSYGYLGVGFDAYGNFSNKYEGSGCTDRPTSRSACPARSSCVAQVTSGPAIARCRAARRRRVRPH